MPQTASPSLSWSVGHHRLHHCPSKRTRLLPPVPSSCTLMWTFKSGIPSSCTLMWTFKSARLYGSVQGGFTGYVHRRVKRKYFFNNVLLLRNSGEVGGGYGMVGGGGGDKLRVSFVSALSTTRGFSEAHATSVHHHPPVYHHHRHHHRHHRYHHPTAASRFLARGSHLALGLVWQTAESGVT